MLMMLSPRIMSVRTTVTLDEDALERLKLESQSRGLSFRETLNELLRTALLHAANPPPKRTLNITPIHMGFRAGLLRFSLFLEAQRVSAAVRVKVAWRGAVESPPTHMSNAEPSSTQLWVAALQ